MTDLQFNHTQLLHLADLLMGAAYSDGEYDGFEAGEIGDILYEVMDGELPAEVSMRLAKYEPDSFSVPDACQGLALKSKEERCAVVALVSRVTEADNLHDLAESEYIRKVVKELGGDVESYEEHMFDIVIVKPPPLPPKG